LALGFFGLGGERLALALKRQLALAFAVLARCLSLLGGLPALPFGLSAGVALGCQLGQNALALTHQSKALEFFARCSDLSAFPVVCVIHRLGARCGVACYWSASSGAG
jgi:hypothetical protein